MSSEVSLATGAAGKAIVRATEAGSRFFVVMPILLLCIVLIGFARTFFLRPLFDVPPIPARLYLHGALQAAWFCLLIAQATLVAKGRVQLHRRLGIGGGILAAAIAVVTFYTLFRFPARLSAGELSTDVTFDPAIVLWTDYAELGVYTAFVSVALWFRRRAGVHKRLMLLASMALVVPALSRMIAPLAPTLLSWLTAHHLPPLVPVIIVALPLTLVVHDVASMRRLHPATLSAVPLMILVLMGAAGIASSL